MTGNTGKPRGQGLEKQANRPCEQHKGNKDRGDIEDEGEVEDGGAGVGCDSSFDTYCG